MELNRYNSEWRKAQPTAVCFVVPSDRAFAKQNARGRGQLAGITSAPQGKQSAIGQGPWKRHLLPVSAAMALACPCCVGRTNPGRALRRQRACECAALRQPWLTLAQPTTQRRSTAATLRLHLAVGPRGASRQRELAWYDQPPQRRAVWRRCSSLGP